MFGMLKKFCQLLGLFAHEVEIRRPNVDQILERSEQLSASATGRVGIELDARFGGFEAFHLGHERLDHVEHGGGQPIFLKTLERLLRKSARAGKG